MKYMSRAGIYKGPNVTFDPKSCEALLEALNVLTSFAASMTVAGSMEKETIEKMGKEMFRMGKAAIMKATGGAE